jgi:hypothetical protein
MRLAESRDIIELNAHNADKPNDAFYYYNLLFGGMFPAR